jgi:hypothetical protein
MIALQLEKICALTRKKVFPNYRAKTGNYSWKKMFPLGGTKFSLRGCNFFVTP